MMFCIGNTRRAAEKGSVEIVELPLDAGADASITGTGGKTPLDLAGEKGRAKILEMLKEGATARTPGPPARAFAITLPIGPVRQQAIDPAGIPGRKPRSGLSVRSFRPFPSCKT